MSDSDLHLEVQYVTGMEPRLQKRLCKTLTTLSSNAQNHSILDVSSSKAEREAIYRFWGNKNVKADDILASHARMTEERCQPHNVVLFAQDTTEVTLPNEISGVGFTHGKNTFGYFIHALLALTPDGMPLGCFSHTIWSRENDRTSGKLRENELHAIPIEEKESFRWLENYRATGEFAQRHPDITSVCLADSEADMYCLLAMKRPTPNLHLIVRAFRDRDHVDKDKDKEIVRISKKLASSRLRGQEEIVVHVRPPKTKGVGKRHEPRKEREATVEIRACAVRFKRPDQNPSPKKFVSLHAVSVKEIDPPKGETPVEWTLLTTLSIKTKKDVARIVDYYRKRWQIELYFRTLKGGCALEKRRFSSFKRLETCASLLMIIAWRVMAITYGSRKHPEESCEIYFERVEWQALYAFLNETDVFPKEPPTIGEFIIKLASLSGYSPKAKYPPGVKVIWKSMYKLSFITLCWEKNSKIRRSSQLRKQRKNL